MIFRVLDVDLMVAALPYPHVFCSQPRGLKTLSRFQCGCLLLAKLLQLLEELGIGSLEKIGVSSNFQCQNVNRDRGLGMTG